MIAVILSSLAAVVLTVRGPVLLRRVGGDRRLTPRAMLAIWTLSTFMWVLTLGSLLFLLIAEALGPGVKGVITACATLLQALYRNEAALQVALLLAAGAVLLLRLLWVALRRMHRVAHWRRDHHRKLASSAAAETIGRQRVWLVDTHRPDAYCLPGDRFGIVITQGALDVLTPREIRAVLAHERAHLRGHHHLLVSWARLLATAFPFVPLISAAAEEIPVLVEWAADDQAARSVGAGPLAHALGAMASPGAAGRDTAVLAASGACTVQRVRRLVTAPATAPTRIRRALLTGAALTALVAPPVLLLAATVSGVAASHCACPA